MLNKVAEKSLDKSCSSDILNISVKLAVETITKRMVGDAVSSDNELVSTKSSQS